MNNNLQKFMVCIHCMTYNHAPYIEDAMNGFCMQQTDFPFVAIIVDDASTDGEPEVIKSYLNAHFMMESARQWETDDARFIEAQHKENANCTFAVVLLKYNFWQAKKSKDPLMKRWNNSKYIALCEGDDYWTHPEKLQKQVDYLESAPDISMCFHRSAVLDYLGKGCGLHSFEIEDREYTSDELFSQWIVPTNSMVYKRICMNYPIKHRERILNGDIIIVLSCTHSGKVCGMSEFMSVYRIHKGGVTYDSKRKFERTMKYPDHDECIRDNFPRISKDVIEHSMGHHYYLRSLIQTDKKQKESDYEKAYLYIPHFFKQKRKEKFKCIIKKIILFPFHLFME